MHVPHASGAAEAAAVVPRHAFRVAITRYVGPTERAIAEFGARVVRKLIAP
jgi:hypothetical protein